MSVEPPFTRHGHAPSPDQTAVWLLANAALLADRPDLFRGLAPLRRVHGDARADRMASMVAAARGQARPIGEEMAAYSAAERFAHGFPGRPQVAVSALIAAPDAVECALAEWPHLLGGTRSASMRKGRLRSRCGCSRTAHWRVSCQPGRDAWVRPYVTGGAALRGSMAPRIARDALARLRIPNRDLPRVVSAREAEALQPRGAAQAYGFLAHALAAAILR
jgi:hypothetical protein